MPYRWTSISAREGIHRSHHRPVALRADASDRGDAGVRHQGELEGCLVENSFDDYHLLSTHSTWLNYLKSSGVEMKRPEKGEMLPAHGVGKDLATATARPTT